MLDENASIHEKVLVETSLNDKVPPGESVIALMPNVSRTKAALIYSENLRFIGLTTFNLKRITNSSMQLRIVDLEAPHYCLQCGHSAINKPKVVAFYDYVPSRVDCASYIHLVDTPEKPLIEKMLPETKVGILIDETEKIHPTTVIIRNGKCEILWKNYKQEPILWTAGLVRELRKLGPTSISRFGWELGVHDKFGSKRMVELEVLKNQLYKAQISDAALNL